MHTRSFVQPDLTDRIENAIEEAGGSGLTYRELAGIAYGLGEREPSKAQLSAVRRSVALLVKRGRAERGGCRRGTSGLGRSEVEIRCPLTPAEREVKAQRGEAAIRWLTERREAEVNAINYPVDPGGGIVEVPIEPVLIIRESGVELREPELLRALPPGEET